MPITATAVMKMSVLCRYRGEVTDQLQLGDQVSGRLTFLRRAPLSEYHPVVVDAAQQMAGAVS